MKSQEDFILAHCRNAQDKSNQIGAQETPADTEIASDFTPTLNASTSVKETETMASKDISLETREELLKRIIEEETLN